MPSGWGLGLRRNEGFPTWAPGLHESRATRFWQQNHRHRGTDLRFFAGSPGSGFFRFRLGRQLASSVQALSSSLPSCSLTPAAARKG